VSDFRARVWMVVKAIPKGRVLSYGAVAALAGKPGAARAIGAALSALPTDSGVPWWRVLSASGRITTPRIHHIATLQGRLLEDEGVEVSETGRIAMRKHAWHPSAETVQRLSQTPPR